jgi:MSHA biogenesis protein MshP
MQLGVVAQCEKHSTNWIPACSGMTGNLQRGFSIVSAIFLLVVLSFLGVAMVTFSTSQHQSSAMDVMGSRAYQAARAGIEWGAYQVLQNPAGIACSVGGTSNPVAMPVSPSTLSGFTVDVSCWSYAPITEAGTPVTMNKLISTATQGAVSTSGYVERQITVTIAK